MRQLARVSVIVLFASVVTNVAPAAAANPTCQRVTRTVTLSEVNLTPRTLVGWLCANGSPAGRTVQVLVHGLTYDHTYWDFPVQPETYSYVRAATAAGYATFAIDRIGVGQSERPGNPAALTTGAAAHVLHQLVQDLRAGRVGGVSFSRVITVGHSFGSQAVAAEASDHGDVDAVVLTGSLHQASTQAFTVVLPTFHPATLDPKFTGTGVPLGYLTTMPGTRGASFHGLTTSPDIVAADETLKQTATEGEIATIDNGSLRTDGIDVPVLIAVGQLDVLYCDALAPCTDAATVAGRERSHFGARTCLETFVLPTAGHSINLHPAAPNWQAAAADWAHRRIGTKGRAPSQPCLA
jgi:pimeloyl-ACP methyl ester carboxylesterase